jgi:uncharacterized phage protein (TIGR02216 family)
MGLSPRDFWALSLPEWRALTGAFAARHGVAAPLARADLESLMKAYPDHG